jgi:hypothetical protein
MERNCSIRPFINMFCWRCSNAAKPAQTRKADRKGIASLGPYLKMFCWRCSDAAKPAQTRKADAKRQRKRKIRIEDLKVRSEVAC